MVVLTDAPAATADAQSATDSIWKTEIREQQHPQADAGDDVPVTVHGGAGAAPAAENPPRSTEPAVAVHEAPVPQPAREPPAAPAVESAPLEPKMPAKKQTRRPSVIEQLPKTQPELELRRIDAPSVQLVVEAVAEASELNVESESEIEVSHEAETLVEASVAPVTYTPPEEIALADATPARDVATHLREGAWRSAMSANPEARTALAPLRIPARLLLPKRRLSIQRVGLLIAAIGALAAVAYSVRLAPGTGSAPVQAVTAPAQPDASPAGPAIEATQPAAGVAAAVPGVGLVRRVESVPLVVTAPPAIDRVVPDAAAKLEAPPPAAKAIPRQPPPAPRASVETTPPPPRPAFQQARRAPAEAPRPCTAAVAALGLCTLETSPEGK